MLINETSSQVCLVDNKSLEEDGKTSSRQEDFEEYWKLS